MVRVEKQAAQEVTKLDEALYNHLQIYILNNMKKNQKKFIK